MVEKYIPDNIDRELALRFIPCIDVTTTPVNYWHVTPVGDMKDDIHVGYEAADAVIEYIRRYRYVDLLELIARDMPEEQGAIEQAFWRELSSGILYA